MKVYHEWEKQGLCNPRYLECLVGLKNQDYTKNFESHDPISIRVVGIDRRTYYDCP